MKKLTSILFAIVIFKSICLAQGIDSTDLDFGTDSLYNLQLELKAQQGNKTDCEFAIINAKKDFKNNSFTLHSPAFFGDCSYCAVLNQDYNIDWLFENDLFSNEYYRCYDSIMSINLIQKHGYNIFEATRIKVDSLESTDNWISNAEYIGGQNELLKFITTRLSIDSTDMTHGINTKLYIILEIDTTGKAINPIIKKGIGEKTDKKVLEIINEMPNWKPAYLYGKPIRQQYIIPINIDYH